MTDSKRNGICRVIGLRRRGKIEYSPHHIDHLRLLCPAVAYNRLLDLQRCILKHLHTGMICGKEYDASCV